MSKQYSESEIKKFIAKDPKVRRAIARQSHEMFFNLYLSDYIKYKTALFQKEMFEITEDKDTKTAVIVAFRGSAKSTIMSLSYPIWAMLGEQKKKYIIILSQTQTLCLQILFNIRAELETNELLIRDFGPFKGLTSQWKSNVLSIDKYGAKIAAISCGESIRGISSTGLT